MLREIGEIIIGGIVLGISIFAIATALTLPVALIWWGVAAMLGAK